MAKEVKVVVSAEASKFQKGMSDAEKSASKLHSALDRFGPVGSGIANILAKLGFNSVGAAAGLGVAAGAVAAVGAAAEKAIDHYVELGAKVRDYSIITGQSAEASSRQVQAFAELGVSEETAAAGMVKLSKAIETTPKKLEALGIEIARDSSGNVALGATLLNVANAFQSTNDAAVRNEIALTAFGRGGAAMIPILEADRAQLKRLEKQIQTVYTAEDLKRVHDYQVAQKELDRSSADLANSIGAKLLPARLALIQSANENIWVDEHLDEQNQKMNGTIVNSRVAWTKAAQALREQWQEAQTASAQADDLAASQQKAAESAQAEADAENKLYDSIHKNIDAGFAMKQAEIDLVDAEKRYNAVDGHTQENLLRLKESYVKVADAAVAQAEAQAEANQTTLTAAEKAKIFNDYLGYLISTLDANSPLRKELQGYIDQLRSIPGVVQTKISTSYGGIPGKTGGTAVQHFAEGGMVGGSSAEHPVMARAGEMVLTPEQQSALGSGAGGGVHHHWHIGTLIATEHDFDRLGQRLLRGGRYRPGT